MSEKSKGQLKQEELSYKKKNYFETASDKERKEIFDYAEGYKAFLDAAKTEREACDFSVAAAKKAGFTEYRFGDKLKAGDKKYFVNRGKSVVVFRVGTKNPEEDGFRLIASHIDAPRVDIKQNPLYALLRRHQKVSVDGDPARAARRRRVEGRQKSDGQRG